MQQLGLFRRVGRVVGTGAALAVFALALAGTASASASINVACGDSTGLINAINTANTSGGGSVNLAPGCTYPLTSAFSGEDGLPAVMTPITVNGNGSTIAGNDTDFRVFEVDGPGGKLTLQSVTITGGNVPDFGGGILDDGARLTLNRSVVTGNTAGMDTPMGGGIGGGIASGTFFSGLAATLTLNSSQVNGNIVLGPGAGGGIATGNYALFFGTQPGPASSLTANKSQVDDNMAPGSGGGGIQNLAGNVTINSSEVNDNTAANGAGISSGNGMGGAPPGTSTLVVNKSEVDGNTAIAPAPTMMGGGPPFGAGGIANGNSATINNSQIEDNTATHIIGGGIVNHGAMTINKSVVKNNHAPGQGKFGSAGGIVNINTGDPNSGVLTINNSQVNLNTASFAGGGILNGFPGMSMPAALLTMNHSQVNGNSAAMGGGIFNGNGAVTLNSTAITLNTPDNCEPPGGVAGCTG